MRGIIFFLITAIVFALIGWFAHFAYTIPGNPIAPTASPRPTPLSKYKIENLSLTSTESAEIVIDRQLKKTEDYTSSVFKMSYNPGLNGNGIKTVSGLLNEPNSEGKFPAVLLFRGFVPKEKYFIGNGSAFISEYLVKNGFITIAPDFLGYGESDIEAENIFESRFQTYTTAITLLRNVKSFEKWDGENIFIWGHSNGGQITLTLLEATGIDYPSVLWAPVSKPFPYSVLYYTDEAGDEGKFLRKNLAEFEKDYDPMLFSLTGYLDRINAPIQIHQGTNDEAVPLVWTSLLVKNLRSLNKEVEFITYPEANHNLTPGWNTAAENTLNFYRKFLVE